MKQYLVTINGESMWLPLIPDPLKDETYSLCLALSPYEGYSCTAEKDHTAEHIACDPERVIEIWSAS